MVVDPDHKLATQLRENGLLDVAITKKGGYDNGMAQPAVLVLKGKGSGEVLEQWAIVPGAVRYYPYFFFLFQLKKWRLMVIQMNLGGAKDRPDLNQIWDNVQAKLEGKPPVHTKYTLTTFIGTMWGKIFG